MNDRVRITFESNFALVMLNRGDKHNGVDRAMLQAMLAAQKQLRRDRRIRAVILAGNGPSFCAGLDFKNMMGRPLQMALAYSQLLWPLRNHFQRWSMGWRELGVPVIALVHGNCFGAGLQLALGADIRIGTPDAQLSLMESKWGLVPDMGGPTLLRELLPLDRVKELTLTGRVVSGTQAHALGLLTHLSEDPMTPARALIEEIATRSPDAVAAGKFLLQDAWQASAYGALAAERHWQRNVLGFANQRLAMKKGQPGSTAPDYAPRRIGR